MQVVKLITPVDPDDEPITVAQARVHLRVAADAVDDVRWIRDNLPRVRQECEQYLERALAKQTLAVAAPQLGPVTLPMGPVRSVSGIKYTDPAGVEQPLVAGVWTLDTWFDPACVYAVQGATWPSAQSGPSPMRVTYLTGYRAPSESGDHELIPGPCVNAMLLLLGHRFENREAVIVGTSAIDLPLGVQHLLNPYRASVGV